MKAATVKPADTRAEQSRSRSSSYALPILLSVLAHGLLVAAITWGWQASAVTPRVFKPSYVEAKLVKLTPKTPKQKQAKPKANKVDLTAKRRAQEKRAKAEAQKKRQIQLNKEKKAKAAQEKARKKAEQEKAQQEKERLAELERERQRRAEEARQEARDAQFADALADEAEFLQAETDAVKAQSYVALITSRIEQNWSRPPSARKGMTCELQLQLVPTGKVVNVTVVKGSGNGAFDRSAVQAVKKAERFPELQEMPPQVFERYFRQLRLVFNPKDLRL